MNLEEMAKTFVSNSFSSIPKDALSDKMLAVLSDIVYVTYLKSAKDVLSAIAYGG